MRVPAVGIARSTTIKRINPAVDVFTRTVEIVADLDNADGALKPGMLAEIDFGAARDAGAADATASALPEKKR